MHYQILNNFRQGNFSLPSITAPTFYSVGFLALAWSRIFGMPQVPVLTLLVSVGCFYIFTLILNQRFNRDLATSLLTGFLILCNPLFVFTMWGFMTDNYFLFFLLLSIYFLLDYQKYLNFILGNMFIVISYFARQLGLVTSISFAIYLFLKKEYKKSLVQLSLFLMITVYHFLFFPKTGEMLETKFEFSNLTYVRLVFTFLIIFGVYLAFSFFPLIVNQFQNVSKKRLFLIGLVTAPLLLVFNLYFKPTIQWRQDFPYLIYTVQQNGFFTENLHGQKSIFPLNHEIYVVTETLAKVLFIMFLLKIVLNDKKRPEFSLIFTLAYIGVLLISAKVYDRYLIPGLVTSALFLAQKHDYTKWGRLLTAVFVMILAFYSYNYESDYFLTNKYVWGRSVELVQQGLATGNQITATDAWRYLYPRSTEIYKFTYDDPTQGDYSTKFTLVDKKQIEYPLSIWKNNSIYLYKASK